ncbi:hypothetical protein BDW42DRAFT_23528 [Aspergillus taichungensis]|uniref:EthD domain-containing protein n=1 Tax=Aspergillus taichungensis TaxID=482145 RepID=A0A2J5HH12_9EURO|nr:hypothetical protein BDW42DRAFT_23528 [Aspergillus taichungensis]
MSVKQRLLRIAVSHNRHPSLSEEQFHQWATKEHCARAARIHARHGIEAYGMLFSPETARTTVKNLNRTLGGSWAVDEHDVTVEFYLHSLDQLTSVLEDPEFKTLQQEEEPYVSGKDIVATLGWVEAYVQNGRVVNLDPAGVPTYPNFGVLADFSSEQVNQK